MRKKTRRTIWPARSGLEVVQEKTAPPPRDVTLRVLISIRQAVEDLRLGKLTRYTWDDLAFCVNAATVLARDIKLGPEYMPDILAARESVLAMGKRGVKSGRFVATGQELNNIRVCVDVLEAQINAATAQELSRSVSLVRAEEKTNPIYVIEKDPSCAS